MAQISRGIGVQRATRLRSHEDCRRALARLTRELMKVKDAPVEELARYRTLTYGLAQLAGMYKDARLEELASKVLEMERLAQSTESRRLRIVSE